MIFSAQEIQRLLEIVDYHSSFVAGSTVGKEYLSDYDKFILNKHGIDPDKLKQGKETSYFEMYMWGKLSATLSDSQAKQVTFKDFEKHIKRGQYIPLTKVEQNQYDIASQASYSHIKGLGDRMKQDVNGIIIEQDQKSRADYEKVIKGEMKRGVADRKSVSSIVSEIGSKTDDWNRDWGRIVETEGQKIFNQGRSVAIKEKDGSNAKVIKETYPLACKHCIRLHLTDGIGSKPIIFTLEQLEANGSNYGKKTADWKATIDPEHPYCRCNIVHIPENYEWDEEKSKFAISTEDLKYKRTAKAKITVGDSEFLV